MRRFSTASACALVALALVAGCSRGRDNVTANATAPAGFVPPTALNRTDFLDMVDHRFSELDVDRDSELSQQEYPLRHHDIVAGFDTNHDGHVTKGEFEQGALSRFDKADINGDKVLTGEERRSAELAADTANGEAPANGASAAPAASNAS